MTQSTARDSGAHSEKICSKSAICEKAFLYQRLSVMIQRYNAVDILGTCANTTPEDQF